MCNYSGTVELTLLKLMLTNETLSSVTKKFMQWSLVYGNVKNALDHGMNTYRIRMMHEIMHS